MLLTIDVKESALDKFMSMLRALLKTLIFHFLKLYKAYNHWLCY